MGPLLALLITFGLMWALLILPQQRRMRQHQAVIASLEPGDEVVTAGGVYGTIVSVEDEVLAVEVAPGIVLRVLRNAVSQRVAPADELDAEQLDGDQLDGDQLGGADVDRTSTDHAATDREDEV